jgi:hypothetical protein
MADNGDHQPLPSRRQVLAAAGGTGLLTATGAGVLGGPAGQAVASTAAAGADGTPEQVHLAWGDDPATSVVVSWASPGPAEHPRVHVAGHRPIPAQLHAYTDGVNGERVWAYHARVGGMRPGTGYTYTVTADNDASGHPFAGHFKTAPQGRAAFRFTSFGDLATPNTKWVLSYGQSTYAVGTVEVFRPLFHLLNGDLCYANLDPAAQPEVWRDFGNNNQASAARRPWMPCLGNHEVELGNGAQGYTSYLARYLLPDNGTPAFRGRWYSFRVGSALFISLDASDVVYQDAAAFVAGPAPLTPAASTGNPAIPPGTSFYIRATRAAPRPHGCTGCWRRPAATTRSTGSSSRCTRTRRARRRPGTVPTGTSGPRTRSRPPTAARSTPARARST